MKYIIHYVKWSGYGRAKEIIPFHCTAIWAGRKHEYLKPDMAAENRANAHNDVKPQLYTELNHRDWTIRPRFLYSFVRRLSDIYNCQAARRYFTISIPSGARLRNDDPACGMHADKIQTAKVNVSGFQSVSSFPKKFLSMKFVALLRKIADGPYTYTQCLALNAHLKYIQLFEDNVLSEKMRARVYVHAYVDINAAWNFEETDFARWIWRYGMLEYFVLPNIVRPRIFCEIDTVTSRRVAPLECRLMIEEKVTSEEIGTAFPRKSAMKIRAKRRLSSNGIATRCNCGLHSYYLSAKSIGASSHFANIWQRNLSLSLFLSFIAHYSELFLCYRTRSSKVPWKYIGMFLSIFSSFCFSAISPDKHHGRYSDESRAAGARRRRPPASGVSPSVFPQPPPPLPPATTLLSI